LAATLIARDRILKRIRAGSAKYWATELALAVVYVVGSGPVALAAVGWVFSPPPPPPGVSIVTAITIMLLRGALIYGFALLSLATWRNREERRRLEEQALQLRLRTETLQSQRNAARLDLLRSQLNPHFLFNALHAVGGIVLDGDRRQAHRALTALSLLLRRSLDHGRTTTAPLSDELDLVREYLTLEKLRLGERLEVEFDVPNELLGEPVPALILLPLVENAVRHGIAPRVEGGKIKVSTCTWNGGLRLRVDDDGVGLEPKAPPVHPESGLGLANCRERLRTLYGEAGRLEITQLQPRGARVDVFLGPRSELIE
jgi:LytS/YehU family sensor histidine kinase